RGAVRVDDPEDGVQLGVAGDRGAGQRRQQVAVDQAEPVGQAARPDVPDDQAAVARRHGGAEVAPGPEVAAGVHAGGEERLQVGHDVAPPDGHELPGGGQAVAEARLHDVDAGAGSLVDERDDDVGAGAGLVVLRGPQPLGRVGVDDGGGRVEAGEPQVLAL